MKENINQGTIGILYRRYREYLLPCAVILICIVLFIQVIIPQAQDFISMREEENVVRERINILRSNLNFLSNLDEQNLDSDFQLASSTLPSEKDFVGVLNAIVVASSNSGVKVGDFTFQVGDLFIKPTQAMLYPSLNLSLTIGGGAQGAKLFLSELSKTIPLSDISDVQITGGSSNLMIVFYYKPIMPVAFNYGVPVKPLSSQERLILERISSFVSISSKPTPLATSSGAF